MKGFISAAGGILDNGTTTNSIEVLKLHLDPLVWETGYDG